LETELPCNRRGYFWRDRFKSVIFEKGETLVKCLAYIDLNYLLRYPEVGNLVSEYISSQELLGMIRLMGSPYYRPELKKEKFMSAMQEMIRYDSLYIQ
jgi:hypothetical protein